MILALDLASTTGWAHGAAGEQPSYGSLRFAPAGAERAAYFRGLREWLGNFICEHPVKIVVFETPIPASFLKGHTNMNTLMLLYGLANHVEEFFYQWSGMSVFEADLADIRRHFLGGGRPYKRADAKAVIQKCRTLNLWPERRGRRDCFAPLPGFAARPSSRSRPRRVPEEGESMRTELELDRRHDEVAAKYPGGLTKALKFRIVTLESADEDDMAAFIHRRLLTFKVQSWLTEFRWALGSLG
jgi:hypothetical protein